MLLYFFLFVYNMYGDDYMKKNNNEYKLYILIFCSIVLYAILVSLQNIPLLIFNISENTKNIEIYYIIYQIFAVSSSILYFLIWKKEDYEKIVKQIKNYLIGISAIVTYFLLSQLQLLPFQLLNIDYNKIPLFGKVIYLLCYEAILIGIIILIHFKKLKNDAKDLKKNHKNYYKNCLKYWFIALFIMYVSNFIISLLKDGLPNNEALIREQFQISPIYIFVSAVIFAPVLEELIFRQSFRNLINNKWLFIIISGLVFGGMHVFNGSNITLIDMLYIIPYSVPGMAFAYMLYKTDNIFVPMGFHMLHNGIMVALQFLVVYFV